MKRQHCGGRVATTVRVVAGGFYVLSFVVWAQASAPPPVLVTLAVDSQTRLWTAKVNGQDALTGNDFKTKPAPVLRHGVQFEADEERTSLTVGLATNDVVVSVEGFPDWTVTVPATNRCAFRINEAQRLVDLTTPAGNTTNVVLRFPDGGRALMWPVSFARYDVMDDTSYYLSGQGHVEAEEADGVKKLLSPQGYPMVGGPLTEKVDNFNRRRLRRIIPPVAVSISGMLRQQLGIATESGTFALPENRSAVLEFENGALVSFTHDAINGWLRWHVQKGYVHFHIPEIRCWRAMALTDQRGEIQWSADSHAVDLHNDTPRHIHPPNRFVIAALSHSMTGSVGPGSILQYLQFEECTTFSAAGVGDEVELRNIRTGETTRVLKTNVLVQHGRPPGGVLGTADTHVATGAKGTVIVRSEGVSTSVSSGREHTITGQNGRELTIDVHNDGTIMITSTTGDHTLALETLPGWTFTVREGDTIIIQPTGRADIHTLWAHEGNRQPVDAVSTDGFIPRMPGGTAMTFINADTTSTVEGGDGQLVFFEGGGVSQGGARPFGAAEVVPPSMDARGTPQPFGRLINDIDPARILQPPASVVR